MIRVVHNAVDEVFDCGDCENLAEVLECSRRSQEECEAEAHLYTHIRIDGLDLPEDSFSRLDEISIAGVEQIEVESRPSVEIAISSLRHSAEYVVPVRNALDRVVDLFRRGRSDEASDLLAHVSDSLGVLVAAVTGAANVIPESAEALLSPIGDLIQWLELVIEGQGSGDWINVADLLEYEIDPRLEAWGRAMTQVLEGLA